MDALPVRLARMCTSGTPEHRRPGMKMYLTFNHYPDIYVTPVGEVDGPRVEIIVDIFTNIDPADAVIAHLHQFRWYCGAAEDPDLVCTSPGSEVLARIPRTRIRSDKQLARAIVQLTWHLVDS